MRRCGDVESLLGYEGEAGRFLEAWAYAHHEWKRAPTAG